MLTAGLMEQPGGGTKKRGLKVDFKLDLHPSLHQKSLAGLLLLNSIALQARVQILVHALCKYTFCVFEALHAVIDPFSAVQDAWMLLEPIHQPL